LSKQLDFEIIGIKLKEQFTLKGDFENKHYTETTRAKKIGYAL
jgi:hypothetical protein